MKWLEVIKLRSAGRTGELPEEFWGPIAEADQYRGLVEMRSYRHAALDTDLSLHLHWESDRPEPSGSALGHQLEQALKEFGLTDHSVWIEEEKRF